MAAAAPLSVAIVGGSIAGLATATALLRLGIRVRVFELSPTPLSGKGGSLGFVDVPLWEQLKGARMMRRGTFASRQQGAFLYGDLCVCRRGKRQQCQPSLCKTTHNS